MIKKDILSIVATGVLLTPNFINATLTCNNGSGFNYIPNFDRFINLQSVYSLEAINVGLTNIDGLQNLTYVKYDLDLSNSEVHLDERDEVEYSYPSYHSIPFNTLGDVNGLMNLKHVGGDLKLSYIDLNNCLGLQNLTYADFVILNDNKLSNIDNCFNNIETINTLFLYNNQLTDTSGLSYITHIETLKINSNQLSQVDGLNNLSYVDFVDMSNNQLTYVYGLSNISTINTINISNNQLTSISSFEDMKVDKISYIELNNNNLNDLNGLYNLTKITSIYVTYNDLKNLSGLDNITYVFKLDVSNNPSLVDIKSIYNISNVGSYIKLPNNQYTQKIPYDSWICQNIDSAKIQLINQDGNSVEVNSSNMDIVCDDYQPNNDCQSGFEGDPYKEYDENTGEEVPQSIICSNEGLDDLSPGWLKLKSVDNSKVLKLDNNSIKSIIFLDNLRSTGSLDISNNSIKNIPEDWNITVSNSINMSNNDISYVKINEVMSKANEIDISNNKIYRVEIDNRDEYLKDINMSNNIIEDVSISNLLVQLSGNILDISHNKLSNIDWVIDTQDSDGDVNNLYFNNNDIKSFNLLTNSSNVKFDDILINNNAIENLKIDNITIENLLDISSNNLKSIIITNSDINTLDISNNSISIDNQPNLSGINSDIDTLIIDKLDSDIIQPVNKIVDCDTIDNIKVREGENIEQTDEKYLYCMNMCNSGFYDSYSKDIDCNNKIILDSLPEGYLYLTNYNSFDIDLSNNGINDISNLSNLVSVNSLYLSDNNIDNISPLSSITSINSISIDEKEYSGKLDSNSYICQNFDGVVYNESGEKWDPSHKSWICE